VPAPPDNENEEMYAKEYEADLMEEKRKRIRFLEEAVSEIYAVAGEDHNVRRICQDVLGQAITEPPKLMTGQRVILNGKEIGTVVSPVMTGPGGSQRVRVHSPSKNYDSEYALHNVKPLPKGQL
jgi:hypothetical protein